MNENQSERATLRPFASTAWHLGASNPNSVQIQRPSINDGSRYPVVARLGGSSDSNSPSSKTPSSSSGKQPKGSSGNDKAWFNFVPRGSGFSIGAGGGAAAWVSKISTETDLD